MLMGEPDFSEYLFSCVMAVVFVGVGVFLAGVSFWGGLFCLGVAFCFEFNMFFLVGFGFGFVSWVMDEDDVYYVLYEGGRG